MPKRFFIKFSSIIKQIMQNTVLKRTSKSFPNINFKMIKKSMKNITKSYLKKVLLKILKKII